MDHIVAARSDHEAVTEWEKLKILGEGSYGTVSLAVLTAPEEAKGELIAVKTSKPHGLDSLQKEETILDSFFGCKEILRCIWSLFTMENGRFVYNLLMEFAPCGSLGDLIRKKPLSESQVRVYSRMLLKGLSLVHRFGVVHCDLKPDNILLFPSGEENDVDYQLKIADFGLSRTKDEVFDADFWKIKFRGSPFYMSPESVMGRIETPLDIWSLGCMVIEMMTGFPAWNHIPTTRDLMFKLAFLKEAPPLPSGLSSLCQDFLNKCFVKDSAQRWTANMLLDHPFISAAKSYM
ncbi:hypothetical protein GLYMA_18G244200v4 [Glycine max]|uniref:Protein kinase domain-containing protein n=1 Tax=Glycine max TaxID=3847 RepID=I1N409_SOYBN|nr:mitogen-activated protein kinase kinase kinase 20 [Glycine max]KRH00952.1 hypothetical protein GLYMA_18G244200v4 [Glycine max]|eukprot:XP_006603574.1 mitogen-activated protein kinase kinase kinase 17 [Glycine max]